MDPFVSVVMPVRNEVGFIANALSAVLAQDYPSGRIEVVVADGMSDDRTREVVEAVVARHPSGVPVRIVDNPGRIVATGLNIALNACRGEVVIRIDGHCEVAPDYVRQCVRILAESGAHGVGGPTETVGTTVVAKAIAAAMSAHFGVGGGTFRTAREKAFDADTVPFPAYPKIVLDAAGPYDEELIRNQDDEYNYRLRSLGYRIHLSPAIRSRYQSRSSLLSLFRQYLQYGYWKVRVLQKHPRQMRARQFAPGLFVAAVIVLSAAAPFSRRGWLALLALLLAYLAADVVASVASTRRDGWWLLPVVFPILHVAYGAGFLAGLWVFRNRWGGRVRNGPMPGWTDETARFSAERARIVTEYQRRQAELRPDRYAPWQPAELFFRAGRLRTAAAMLREAGLFPGRGRRVLEVGCGAQGWIPDLLSWGVREADIAGVDLDEGRIGLARESFPAADLRVADASDLPFPDGSFRLVVLSTVFSSILDEVVRRRVASEAARVVAAGGGILWYDFAVVNPWNPHVRGVDERTLRDLFGAFDATVRRATLAPPLARLLAPRASWLASLLEAFPFLRTHRVAVLRVSPGRKDEE